MGRIPLGPLAVAASLTGGFTAQAPALLIASSPAIDPSAQVANGKEAGPLAPAQPKSSDPEPADPLPNWELPTWGGKQFWTDELLWHQWRIQRHAVTGHYRLLDDKQVRRAWGTREQCLREWQQLRVQEQVPPLRKQVVITLHGLMRTRGAMADLGAALETDESWSVLHFTYASSRNHPHEHAESLARVIEHLEAVDRVHFVAHSLGNIVVRYYLGERLRGCHGNCPVPEIGRMVMLGPPNQGSDLARRFEHQFLFRTLAGESGQQLGGGWAMLESRLATPSGEFGILAGGTGTPAGYNPLLPGDDDMVVSVAETRLAGAIDFRVVPILHTWMMSDPQVQTLTRHFLQTGSFETPEKRQLVLPP